MATSKILLATLVLSIMSLCESKNQQQAPSRSLFDFAEMIYALTGNFPTKYNNYGNYCGYGGSGSPVDRLDKCCLDHDDCYGSAQKNQCQYLTQYGVYVNHYNWNVVSGEIVCQGAGYIGDFFGLTKCSNTVCQCDKIAAECFMKNSNGTIV